MATTNRGWLIGQYTGDPYKDRKVTFGTTALSNAFGTITIGAAVDTAIGIGTTNTGSMSVRCTSTAAQLAAGSVIFAGDTASEVVHYWIVHKGP